MNDPQPPKDSTPNEKDPADLTDTEQAALLVESDTHDGDQPMNQGSYAQVVTA